MPIVGSKEISGSPWGIHSLGFSFPSGEITVDGLNPAQVDSLTEYFAGFVQSRKSGAPGNLNCDVYQLENAPDVDVADLTHEGQYSPVKRRREYGIDVTGVDFEASIPLRDRKEAKFGFAKEYESTFPSAFDNLLRIYSAYRVLQTGGVVLHSAGLVIDGKAYIFVGRSGAGKTTLARKASDFGAKVLSDDINLLLPVENTYMAHSVPFTGEFGRSPDHTSAHTEFPVAGIIFLEQGRALEVNPIRASEALSKMLVGSPFVNSDEEESTRLFDVLSSLVRCIPTISLTCRKFDPVDDIIRLVKSGVIND
jgi:hypothetical protein